MEQPFPFALNESHFHHSFLQLSQRCSAVAADMINSQPFPLKKALNGLRPLCTFVQSQWLRPVALEEKREVTSKAEADGQRPPSLDRGRASWQPGLENVNRTRGLVIRRDAWRRLPDSISAPVCPGRVLVQLWGATLRRRVAWGSATFVLNSSASLPPDSGNNQQLWWLLSHILLTDIKGRRKSGH